LVFSQEYLDSSFRTPAEVLSELRIPVLASVPLYQSANGNGSGSHGGNGNGNGNGTSQVPVAGEAAIGYAPGNDEYRR
jgi:hypothetical protein